MFAYILKRILLMLPTLLGVLMLTFAVVQFVPGGPVEQYLAEAKAGAGRAGAEGGGLGYRGAQGVDPKRLEQIKALYGFDKPPHERFLQMLGQFARFDLGRSFFQNKDVWQLVKEKCRCPSAWACGLFSSATWSRCRWAWPRRCGRVRALIWSPRCSFWWATPFPALCWAWPCW
jgi:ABC-type microcin C transport system permease subunit YejB